MQEVSNQRLELDSSMMNKIKPYILPALAVIGILLSLELTLIYFNANFVLGSQPSFCSMNETINCDDVARTQFSHFFGIPLALWGLGFYIFILFLSVMPVLKIGFINDLKSPKSYIFSISSIAVVISLILAGISTMEIHKICILCTVSYLLNFCILVASKSGESTLNHYKYSFKDLALFLSEPSKALFMLIICSIFAIALYYVDTSGIFVPKKNSVAAVTSNSYRHTTVGNILGAKKPKLIIHEYTDFQCPFCAMSHAMMERLVQEVPGVQVVHHDFPLNKNCNPSIKNSIHQNSCEAALYSRAAKNQGKYWEFNSKLFNSQQDLSETKILKIAKSIGLNTSKLKIDASNPLAKKQLINDSKDAINQGVTATPTFFIGIKKYEGIMPYPELKNIVLGNLR